MKSSTGEHYMALDHIRALAAFMVFCWHFLHSTVGSPIPFSYTPSIFLFSILDEGHTGVGLFMALSGYLFAKLLAGRRISYPAFIWNRLLRLVPLLIVVLSIVVLRDFISGKDIRRYWGLIGGGFIFPTLPNGGWSITAEFHFYLVLPLLLWLAGKSRYFLFLIIIGAIILRLFLLDKLGEIQSLAYWTIVGRIDQFVFGILAYQFRSIITGRHFAALLSLLSFALFYQYFDRHGGFYNSGAYPSGSSLWVFMPTIEGLAYSLGIAYYDNSFAPSTKWLSRFMGRLGSYSYSIYLFHFFIVFDVARIASKRFPLLSNFYVACGAALVLFMFMLPLGYLSFRFIESPFLKLRKRYIINDRSNHPADRLEPPGSKTIPAAR